MDSARLKEFRAALAIKHTPYIGPRTWAKLLAAYGGAAHAYDRASRWRMDKVVSVKGCEAFKAGAYKAAARAEFDVATKQSCSLVLWTDPEYSRRLRQIPDPPLFLYCIGRKDLLAGPSVAVVGSRNCTGRGLAVASRICSGLAEAGVTVVSGMAWGIDRQAHLAGLSGAGSSIAVLGTGLDRVYPPENTDLFERLCQSGLVVTEFAPGTVPEARNFPYRNRIVSGLSLGVVVVEAAMKSGSRITARLGLEQGRDVYAVQGPEGSSTFEGCNDLVEQGAQPVTSAGEVILDLAVLIKADAEQLTPEPRAVSVTQHIPFEHEAMHPTGKGSDTPMPEPPAISPVVASCSAGSPMDECDPVDPDQRAIIEVLSGAERVHIDELTRTLGWDQGRTGRTLTLLEVVGTVRQWPGMCYSLS
ncbi:DNA-processing protein DprA [Desulfovibrio ferrophilus]|uniref:DNA protecting protein DprA n=1 Tax=Desulfovibrio ferrophilus TaxID=241368 RepID=A0A2Z6AVG1_9BACT|nr:DNA-processing protein DprA [Desulfovibrio ferrophilus]BBD07221.1 DNA protecting protein DprA [Desulfovibrio ferrophilus]